MRTIFKIVTLKFAKCSLICFQLVKGGCESRKTSKGSNSSKAASVNSQRLTRLLCWSGEAWSGRALVCCAQGWGWGCTGVRPVPPSIRLSKLNGIPLLGVLISMPAILLLLPTLLLWICNKYIIVALVSCYSFRIVCSCVTLLLETNLFFFKRLHYNRIGATLGRLDNWHIPHYFLGRFKPRFSNVNFF